MGAISTRICGKSPIRVNLIGDSGVGKTRILYAYMLGDDECFDTNHTSWYNIEVVPYRNCYFKIVDFGGCDKLQPTFRERFKGVPILIFVIDSSDRESVRSSKDILDAWISTNGVENVILLIFANKQDLSNAMTVPEIVDQYKLKELKCRWHVQPCVGLRAEGISDGFDWICKNFSQ
ncbi:hypothetical protein FQR65_LT11547 [Abscondita terminalis]|nr:hypothetical protein FQR65_LT11547 [Abscondita terminalis]